MRPAPFVVLCAGLFVADAVAGSALAAVAGTRGALPAPGVVEVIAGPSRGALEEGLAGPVAVLYGRAIQALRAGQDRDALALVKRARGLCYQALSGGAAPDLLLAQRHFTRLAFAEELLNDLVLLERTLSRRRDNLTPEELGLLLHERALLSHNKFLLVRSFTGRADERLLLKAQQLYESLLARPGPQRPLLLVHYAALQAERGDRRAAQEALQRLTPEDLAAEPQDLAVAYYHLAQGDKRRAMARLQQAAQRDAWDRPTSARDGRTLRASAYRMNDFDALRDHPLFRALVTQPEEEALRLRLPPPIPPATPP